MEADENLVTARSRLNRHGDGSERQFRASISGILHDFPHPHAGITQLVIGCDLMKQVFKITGRLDTRTAPFEQPYVAPLAREGAVAHFTEAAAKAEGFETQGLVKLDACDVLRGRSRLAASKYRAIPSVQISVAGNWRPIPLRFALGAT